MTRPYAHLLIPAEADARDFHLWLSARLDDLRQRRQRFAGGFASGCVRVPGEGWCVGASGISQTELDAFYAEWLRGLER
jgi:hypothetical protein